MQNFNSPDLIGSVVERAPSASNFKSPSLSPTARAGFPAVQHRSLEKAKGKSAFARSREASKTNTSISRDAPVPRVLPHRAPQSENDWRTQISRENEAKVDGMTEEERQSEIREIMERFGAGVGDILKKAREARERKEKSGIPLEPVPMTSETPEPTSPIRSGKYDSWSPPAPSLSTSSTRPNSPTRGARRLRFAELVPENVHVYESAPPSPRKKSFLALPPPPPSGSGDSSDIVSLGTFENKLPMRAPSDFRAASGTLEEQTSMNTEAADLKPEASSISGPLEDLEPEEGTPEYIRRRFFPSAPADNPDIAWMSEPSVSDKDQLVLGQLRFDLTGAPIPRSKLLSLPTHLGLHHHAEGKSAGYTLDDIFLLSRSKVPAQRAAMLAVLKGIVDWWWKTASAGVAQDEETRTIIEELQGSSPPLLKRVLFAGLEALPERGVVGVRAVEIVWECLVGWEPIPDDEEYYEWGGVELGASELIESFPLNDVLPQFRDIFSLPPDGTAATADRDMTPVQHLIISILHRLALHSNTFADAIVALPKLILAVIRSFIDHYSSASSASTLDTKVLRLFSTLALSSRSSAKSLCEPADMFLRIIATLNPTPQDSHAPYVYAILGEMMRFYTILARYGMFSHIATDGRELWWKVNSFIQVIPSQPAALERHLKLVSMWAGLLESWITCATDPHRTTPSHDLLWSQVIGWEWGKDLLSLSETLAGLGHDASASRQFWRARTAVFGAIAAWLEGCKVNGVKGGEEERLMVKAVLGKTFQPGKLDGDKISSAIVAIKSLHTGDSPSLEPRKLAHGAYEISSIIRVWLACCPPSTQEPLASPPFELPFAQISELCAMLVGRGDWGRRTTSDKGSAFSHLCRRPLTSLLTCYLRLSRLLPGVFEDLWLAQAFSILLTLQPGDEEYATGIIDQILRTITPEWVGSRGLNVPPAIWDRGGWEVVRPFLRFEVNPTSETYISPLCSSPRSISQATTQRLPPIVSSPKTEWSPSGLPLRRDWTASALDHVLHSGSASSLFSNKEALPSTFDASETEIVRASLLLTTIAKEVIRRFANVLSNAVLTREEATFSCMKVFMLEHDQDQNQTDQEVFRDSMVIRYMEELLSAYTLSTPSPSHSLSTLEEVAVGFLGASTPFYQYYTDFVALYDSISFSHPLFARLLLPPTSMRYPVDYRKHLWNDFSHVVKTIRTPIEQVISADLREYLWPVEDDPQMISAYLRALVKDGQALGGFVRLVAIHHIACNIWPDSLHGRDVNEERASKLLKVIVEQGSADVVREVMSYRQEEEGGLVPPTCFGDLGERKDTRLQHIEKWGGSDVLQRVKGLFDQ
ncbi:hypothetical protein V5O48_001884 [Marasmius crinis-equi]|uniref:RNA polymerase II-associated protein 1 C-terminal domain-containing protein n=1 Tax=Marasmius crinis-equi TaxID=585013 RepID=A0ABR3FXP0_9AGAR